MTLNTDLISDFVTIGKTEGTADKKNVKLILSQCDQPFARESFCVGYLMGRLALSEDKALVALNSKGATGTSPLKAGERRRTEREEAAYNAARQGWHALLKRVGVPTAEKRGGARQAKSETKGEGEGEGEGEAPVETTETPVEKVTPRAKEPKDVTRFLRQQSAMLLAYVNKNGDRASIAHRNAVAAFVEACKAFND